MAEVSPRTLAMVLTIGCMSIFAPAGLAQLLPFPPLPPLPFGIGANPQCWSSITGIQGCVLEIITSFTTGKIGVIGPACCTAITNIQSDCWPKLFPLNPFFPAGLKTFCAAPTPLRPSIAHKLEPELKKEQTEITECWSSVANITDCVARIVKAFTTAQTGGIGPACCEAVISTIDNNCWAKMFPFNPFFGPLIKSACATSIGDSPSPPSK
ncbi:uncharacterized protein LOC119997037 [Tripterygium wilfordii]|uniref:uncharacterized protein LOC119997037 n=1 Tax=Tripterygium wilfordii TaxID=458696 RepID=UPI0018F82FF2|nr:uncharacterized protein LOC119997037 [Tripterygium wilfordii]